MAAGKRYALAGTEFVKANDISIAYEDFGSEKHEVVLLIAGTGMQLIDWPIEWVEALVKADFRVIRYDNRDCGLSTKFNEAGSPDSNAITQALINGEPIPTPYSINDMARDAVGLLDALNIQKAHIIGISMGGAIAQYIAIDYPERMHSMVLIGADSGNKDMPVIANPEAFAHIPPLAEKYSKGDFLDHQIETDKVLDSPGYPSTETEITARRKKSIKRDFDPPSLQRQQTAIFLDRFIDPYRYNNLDKIKVPTVVIHGLDDALVPIEASKEIAKKIPGAQLHMIPGLGHNCPVGLADDFVKMILKLVQTP